MNLNSDEKSEEIDEQRKRINKSVEEMDEMKNQLEKWNNQLSEDLEVHRKNLSIILQSGALTVTEAERIFDLKEKVYRLEQDREYEYGVFIKCLNSKNEEQIMYNEEIELDEHNEQKGNNEKHILNGE